jgi:hypothetical protein
MEPVASTSVIGVNVSRMVILELSDWHYQQVQLLHEA